MIGTNSPLVLSRRYLKLIAGVALGTVACLFAQPAAAQQTPCDAVAAAGWGHLMLPAYHFSYASQVQARSTAYLHCVRNNHSSRSVNIDWRGTGLTSQVPPGRTIFQSGPLGSRANARRLAPLYYGARWSLIQVMTFAGAQELLPRHVSPPLDVRVVRATWGQEAPPALVRSGEPAAVTTSLVYVPTDPSFLFGTPGRTRSRAATVEWLESHPDQLKPFSMTFEDRVRIDAQGRITAAYICTYDIPTFEDPGALYLQFSDPMLQEGMFGDATPYPVGGEEYAEPVATFELPWDRRPLVSRTAQLLVLLSDRRTVVASIPVTYSAPAS